MLDREPFLRAIFSDPDNDLPRLVFADYLDDHGDHEWAELIRLQCDIARRGSAAAGTDTLRRASQLLYSRWPFDDWHETQTEPSLLWDRGFVIHREIGWTRPESFLDPDGFREHVCRHQPHWYAATSLSVSGGVITDRTAVETILRSPVLERVVRLVLAGKEELLDSPNEEGFIDFVYRPVISSRMVEYLSTLRECRRLTHLDLTRNDLDNDAVRALARSNYLTRLTELAIQDGNPRVKGRVWSELLARFGPEVVR